MGVLVGSTISNTSGGSTTGSSTSSTSSSSGCGGSTGRGSGWVFVVMVMVMGGCPTVSVEFPHDRVALHPPVVESMGVPPPMGLAPGLL